MVKPAAENRDNDLNDASFNYTLRMYVTGASPNSAKAISNIKNICETHLPGMYDLEIIDIYQEPVTAIQEQVIALPMLVKSAPLPFKRLIGDMSDTKKVLRALGLE
jgi:circadian clock protein KaiB